MSEIETSCIKRLVVYYNHHVDLVNMYAASTMKDCSKNTVAEAVMHIASAEKYATDFEKIILSDLVSEEELKKTNNEIVCGLSPFEFFIFRKLLGNRIIECGEKAKRIAEAEMKESEKEDKNGSGVHVFVIGAKKDEGGEQQ